MPVAHQQSINARCTSGNAAAWGETSDHATFNRLL